MEKIPKNSPEKIKQKEKGMSRRKFLKGVLVAGAAAACPLPKKLTAWAEEFESTIESGRYEKEWYFSLEEMKNIYKEEYNTKEKILKNVFRKKGSGWAGLFEGQEFVVPQEFVDRTLEILAELLEKRTAKYLFRLDAFHGHFFVSEEVRDKRYSSISGLKDCKALVKDKELKMLFHNSEHGKHLVGRNNSREEEELKQGRNVVAHYDGQPLEILPLPKGNNFAVETSGKELIPMLRFAAHKNGEFLIEHDGEEIRLDLSLDDESYY